MVMWGITIKRKKVRQELENEQREPSFISANEKTGSTVFPIIPLDAPRLETARGLCSIQPCRDYEIILHTLWTAHGRNHDSNILKKEQLKKYRCSRCAQMKKTAIKNWGRQY